MFPHRVADFACLYTWITKKERSGLFARFGAKSYQTLWPRSPNPRGRSISQTQESASGTPPTTGLNASTEPFGKG